MDETRRLYPDRAQLELCDTAKEALSGADALAIVTEWQGFRIPDFNYMKQELKYGVVLDCRNLYDPINLKALGLACYGIGRGWSVADLSRAVRHKDQKKRCSL